MRNVCHIASTISQIQSTGDMHTYLGLWLTLLSLSLSFCSRRHHFNCSFFSLFSFSLSVHSRLHSTCDFSLLTSQLKSHLFVRLDNRTCSLSVCSDIDAWERRRRSDRKTLTHGTNDQLMSRRNSVHMSLDNEEQLFVLKSVCVSAHGSERKSTLSSTAQALQWFIT